MRDVLLPQWGMGMQEGEIVEWWVSIGDPVDEDDDLVDVEAEKATGTVKAPCAGVVKELYGSPGERISVGHLLCRIDEE